MIQMSVRHKSTLVTFPVGGLGGKGVIRRAEYAEDGRLLLVVDRTPFHPLDHTWPDQPADRGIVTVGAVDYEVEDVVTGAVGVESDSLYLGTQIAVRRNDPDWAFLVVHVLPRANSAVLPTVGDSIELAVDREYREALSAGHSACHLASLALNQSLAELWTKIPRTDCLGHPDFDQSAIASSRILPHGAVDEYRLGKSLRKSGFTTGALADSLGQVQEAVNNRLASWIQAGGRAHVECEGEELTARRWWNCELPEGTARIPCGGTHVPSTDLLGSAAVELDLDIEASKLTMRTSVVQRYS
jgi:alanyl-tRNA synthetase